MPVSIEWKRLGKPLGKPQPPAPKAVSTSSYALIWDPLARAISYIRPPDYHVLGEIWRFLDGGWVGPLGSPASIEAGEGAWQGHWDDGRKIAVLWSTVHREHRGPIEPLGVAVGEGESSELATRGEIPTIMMEGAFGEPPAIFGYDPKREVTVLLTRDGIWELDTRGVWTCEHTHASGTVAAKWREETDCRSFWDPHGERVVFFFVDSEFELNFLTWNGSRLARLKAPELANGTFYETLPTGLFQPFEHPEHGALIVLGGGLGGFRLDGDAWKHLADFGEGLPRLSGTRGAATPDGALWIGPGTHHISGASTPYRSEVFFSFDPVAAAWRTEGHVEVESAFGAGSGVLAIENGRKGAWVTHKSPGLNLYLVEADGQWRASPSEQAGSEAWDGSGDPGRCPVALATDSDGRLHAFGSKGNVHRLDGESWTTVAKTQAGFGERDGFIVTWYPREALFVAWGGTVKKRDSNDTFNLVGDTWQQLKASSPKPSDFSHGRKDDIYVHPALVVCPQSGALLRFGYDNVSRLEGDAWIPHEIAGYKGCANARRRSVIVDSSEEILIYDWVEGGVTRFDWAGCARLGFAEPLPEIMQGPGNTWSRLITFAAVIHDRAARELRGYLADDGSCWYRLDLAPFADAAAALGAGTEPPPIGPTPTARRPKSRTA